ncbi:hypothetical protein DPMN_095395 [Dreissena polymorpha]|uniref:Uncharacterized protein n=1 Tax=Dreissena polymorpha TaxID=45954 RepID=A0A9D4L7V4_DREPO|nr:hypothetical protein DPMN_095395 [Dreissena polymorpha]
MGPKHGGLPTPSPTRYRHLSTSACATFSTSGGLRRFLTHTYGAEPTRILSVGTLRKENGDG